MLPPPPAPPRGGWQEQRRGGGRGEGGGGGVRKHGGSYQSAESDRTPHGTSEGEVGSQVINRPPEVLGGI